MFSLFGYGFQYFSVLWKLTTSSTFDGRHQFAALSCASSIANVADGVHISRTGSKYKHMQGHFHYYYLLCPVVKNTASIITTGSSGEVANPTQRYVTEPCPQMIMQFPYAAPPAADAQCHRGA